MSEQAPSKELSASITISRATANLIRSAFLPDNPRRMRTAHPDVRKAAEEFIAALAQPAPEPPANDTRRYCVEVSHCDRNADFHIWDGHCNTATAADAEALQARLNRSAQPPADDALTLLREIDIQLRCAWTAGMLPHNVISASLAQRCAALLRPSPTKGGDQA